MVKQRVLVPLRRWLVALVKVVGPILLFKVLVSVRQYLQLAPLGIEDLLMRALVTLLLIAAVLWAVGLGSMALVNTAQSSRLRE